MDIGRFGRSYQDRFRAGIDRGCAASSSQRIGAYNKVDIALTYNTCKQRIVAVTVVHGEQIRVIEVARGLSATTEKA